MDQINRRDLDDLARILARFEDKRTCPCPACRMKRADIPPFTGEDLIRARKRVHEIITLVNQYTQLGLPSFLIRRNQELFGDDKKKPGQRRPKRKRAANDVPA